MATFSTDQFNYDPNTKTFTQDMSMLDQGGTRQVWEQIYPDSCDDGLRLVSSVTGREVKFAVTKTDQNGGDIQGWHLAPTADSIRKYPGVKNLKMLIVNT